MGLCSLFLILSFLSSSAFADQEKEKIFSLLANLPKVTTAKSRRGNTEISIDLSSPAAKSQIEDYDVILLEDGVYATLGDFTAKYVRVRGQGPRKTFISCGSSSKLLRRRNLPTLVTLGSTFNLNSTPLPSD